MGTRTKAVPAAQAAEVVEASAVVPARQTIHVGRTWEAQATRVEPEIRMGNPDAPFLLRCPDGKILVRCVDRSRWYLLINRLWWMTGGFMPAARIGPDTVTYAQFCRK